MSSLSTRVSGHFGELLQGRMGTDGPLALISLPCPPLYVTAQGTLGRSLSIHTAGGRALISPARAGQFLAQLGLYLPARVILRANMPLGAGAGVSTATLVALARLAGWRGDALTLARACVLAEGASDPLMLPAPERVLWASREGRVLAHLPALPAFDILGGFWGPPHPHKPAGFALSRYIGADPAMAGGRAITKSRCNRPARHNICEGHFGAARPSG
jgi:uncharacterized protein involved in propanediol utilization